MQFKENFKDILFYFRRQTAEEREQERQAATKYFLSLNSMQQLAAGGTLPPPPPSMSMMSPSGHSSDGSISPGDYSLICYSKSLFYLIHNWQVAGSNPPSIRDVDP